MQKQLLTLAIALSSALSVSHAQQVIAPSDARIACVGRIVKSNPNSFRFSYPGTTFIANFEGTGLKLHCKPMSGYFMVQIDNAEPFKVAFTGERDSTVQVASALSPGKHTLRAMYSVEGYEYRPEFRGLILDKGTQLLDAPELSDRRIEFIGNSITCGYGSESMNPNERFSFQTENHYIGFAQRAARALDAQAYVVARSGIGVYRNYGGPREGTPKNNMPAQYEYTLYEDKSEKWDFSAYRPQVICVNLGTNDMSTNNYDVDRLRKGYTDFLAMVRKNNPDAKIVFLCGSMLVGKELGIVINTLDEVVAKANKQGDANVFRFNFSPQNGDLGYGADWHPSRWQHEKMAGELVPFLRQLMGWF